MKELYSFTTNDNILINETESTKNEKGEDVLITKKVTKSVPRKFILKKANRAELEEIDLFRAATESEYIRRGILPVTLLQKRYAADDGVFSEKEKKDHEVLTEKFVKLQSEYSELVKIPEKDRTEEQKKKTEETFKELSDVFGKFNELENLTNNLYNRSAEALARNRSILYMVLMLSYEEKDGKPVSVFGDGDFNKRLEQYDKMEEGEKDFDYQLIQKLLYLFSMSYLGKATTKEELDSALKLLESQDLFNK